MVTRLLIFTAYLKNIYERRSPPPLKTKLSVQTSAMKNVVFTIVSVQNTHFTHPGFVGIRILAGDALGDDVAESVVRGAALAAVVPVGR